MGRGHWQAVYVGPCGSPEMLATKLTGLLCEKTSGYFSICAAPVGGSVRVIAGAETKGFAVRRDCARKRLSQS